jgi:poly(3-hydroxybutyrate) depolymerase
VKPYFPCVLLALLLAPSAASAATVTDVPCTGCRAAYTPSADPLPPLVVLHGDWGVGPADLVTAWEKHAAKRGLAVLALKCPVDRGCKGSWWQWNGDPAWIAQQIDAFEKKQSVTVDHKRIYLAGWSGGASYMGMRAQTFQQTFAALVYHGGGIAPGGPCAPASAAPAPAYFLVGDANPLHHLAVSLKKENEQCGIAVTWKLLAGADHTAEWKALDANGGAIVEWLLKKKRP